MLDSFQNFVYTENINNGLTKDLCHHDAKKDLCIQVVLLEVEEKDYLDFFLKKSWIHQFYCHFGETGTQSLS